MATTINAANISIGMDVTKLKEGMGATRSELSKIGSILREAEAPTAKFQREMELMNRALKAGGITVEQYAAAQEKLAAKYGVVTPAMEQAAEEARALEEAQKQAADAANALEQDAARLASILRESEPPINKYNRDIEFLEAALRDGKITTEEFGNAQQKLASKYGIVNEEERQRATQLARAKQLTDSVKTATEIHTDKTNEYRQALKDGVITQETYNRLIRQARLDLEKAESQTNQLTTAIQKQKAAASAGGGLQGLLKGQFGQLAGMAAGALTVSSLAGTAKEFDAIVDKADQLGVSYEDLMVIGKTLEESGGISFDQAGNAIGKMQVNLANARDKGGELDDTLKKMGLSAAELANLDAVTQFQTISQAFGQITNQADKMQFATQLFGKAGIDMVPALEIGAAKFSEMRTHLQEAGLLNEDLAKKMGEAADLAARLMDRIKGVGMFVVGEILPAMRGFNKLIEDSGKGWMNLRTLVQGFRNEGDAIDKALGIVYDSAELEKMTKAERDAFEDNNARRRVEFMKRQKEEARIAEQRKQAEAEVEAEQQRVLERMDKLSKKLQEERKEREAKDREEQRNLKEKEREIDQNIRGVEAERQRLLGSGNQNVAATIAPAIKAGTVEAYKAVNQQNEQRAARAEQIAELRKVESHLRKLAEEKNVILTRVR